MKRFKFTINGNLYDVEIKNFEEQVAEVEVNGTPYVVEVDQKVKVSKTPKLVRPTVKAPAGAEKIQKSGSGGVFTMKAPLPGTILKVLIKIGDEVKRGDKLMVMEAMKMENDVLAEKDGTIKSIHVSANDSVLEGQALIDIE